MNWLTIISSVIFWLWAFAFLYLLWRHAIGGGRYASHLRVLLDEHTKKSAESAEASAQAAREAAEMVRSLAESNKRLVAMLEGSKNVDS